MARPKKIQITKAVSPTDVPERFKLSEIGSTGLRISSGNPLEETLRELQFPNSIRIFQTMQNDSVLGAATEFFRMMMRKSSWNIKRSAKDTPEFERHNIFAEQVLFQDQTDSWGSFIQETSSLVTFGFSLSEIVYRRRNRSKGSRFNDNKIGIKKLAPRSQASVKKFIYDGEELVGVEQDLTLMQPGAFRDFTKSTVVIPVEKLLLFRAGTQRDNPVGRSPLAGCYLDWKTRCAIQENESISSMRDLRGVATAWLPPQYMSEDADPVQKAVYEQYKNIVRNISNGHQSGLVLPLAYDPESKQKLFDFKLLGMDGGNRSSDTNAVIERYDRKILTRLFADLLIMGQGTGGSYNLGTLKSDLVALAVEVHLSEIADVINKDLLPRLFNLNGIELEQYPEVEFQPLGGQDMEVFSKFIQRVKSVGMLDVSIETLNAVRNTMGLEDLGPDFDIEKFKVENSKTQSRAGDGMDTPFEGTSQGGGTTRDNSTANNENSA